jgi:hypothetical protein
MAVQIDVIVSFHMGLPSMIYGIESDTALPRNLRDEDFSEDCAELPPARPDTEYTQLTYPIWKSAICRVLGLVARQAHSLSQPTFAKVMELDNMLHETWAQVPAFMKIRPLEECVADPPSQVLQRFGLGALFQKTRCVLHRQYLIEASPRKEHDYSRRTCLEAALELLGYQRVIYMATMPGGMLGLNSWFVTSLALHDYLLAAMVVYLVIQNQSYTEERIMLGESNTCERALYESLKESHDIWVAMSKDDPIVKMAADVLSVMLHKVNILNHQRHGMAGASSPRNVVDSISPAGASEGALLTSLISGTWKEGLSCSTLMVCAPEQAPPYPSASSAQSAAEPPVLFSRPDLMPNSAPDAGPDVSWIPLTPNAVDWVRSTVLQSFGVATDQYAIQGTFDDAIRGDSGHVEDEWMTQEEILMNGFDESSTASVFWGPHLQ